MRKSDEELLEMVNKIGPIFNGMTYPDIFSVLSRIFASLLQQSIDEGNLNENKIEFIKKEFWIAIDRQVKYNHEKTH